MKKSSIIALIFIGIAIVMIISTVGDASTYASFKEANEFAKEGNNKSIHVVGELLKTPDGQIEGMFYDPNIDPNHFEFMMIDSLNNKSKVIYNQPKPQDLDKSEKVVVVGKMDLKNQAFIADQILLKCPSKYNNDNKSLQEAGVASK